MPAIVRGGSQYAARPRPKAATKTAAKGAGRERAPYAPAKIQAAQGVGLKPNVAVGVASGVALLGLMVALLTGDRLERLAGAIVHAGDLQLAALGLPPDQCAGRGRDARGPRRHPARLGPLSRRPDPGLDLDKVRGRLEHVGWVKQVRVVRLLPDTLVISIEQRPTAAVWQRGGRTFVVDDHGQVIPEADPAAFAGLPLIVGEGANDTLGSILPLVRGRPALMQRLEALVRVDDRRWDVRLKDGGLIQLPAEDAESALIRLDALEQKSRILELGFERIDLRDPELVAVRPRQSGPAAAQAVIAELEVPQKGVWHVTPLFGGERTEKRFERVRMSRLEDLRQRAVG